MLFNISEIEKLSLNSIELHSTILLILQDAEQF